MVIEVLRIYKYVSTRLKVVFEPGDIAMRNQAAGEPITGPKRGGGGAKKGLVVKREALALNIK